MQVADFLSKMMFLTKNVLAFGWVGMVKAKKGSWLDGCGLGSIEIALIGEDLYAQEGGKSGGLYSVYVLMYLDG